MSFVVICASVLLVSALTLFSGFGQVLSYSIGSKTAVITPIKLVMSVLMFVFAMFELLPALRDLRFERRHLFLGGLLSGFFGGLSGHQGALRSAFLVKTGVSTQAFVGTNAVIGFMVDMIRIAAYAAVFLLAKPTSPVGPAQWPLILAGMAAAFIGVLIGKRWLHKMNMKTVQALTGILLLAIAIALGAGII